PPTVGAGLTGPDAMIASLTGRLRRKYEDRIVLETGGVGYEVFLPPIVLRQLEPLTADDGDKASELTLVTHYHATRDQPRPVLIGFTTELDKEFFEKLITVKDMGPMVAARALAAPVSELAAAIARQDEKYLRSLPGIGPQKAKNIVAQLQAKVAKFALALALDGQAAAPPPKVAAAPEGDGLRELVWEVLVRQLGHRPSEASQLIADALARRPGMATAEQLFDEIYRGAKAS
ncbi:MAG: Holliday junction DNA helicase RuvA, partial [Candidatus Rokubacteria bacterium]|nr:Holliday junction DNA helicase RuvA [Candidatus Rokubacteria bacterium]